MLIFCSFLGQNGLNFLNLFVGRKNFFSVLLYIKVGKTYSYSLFTPTYPVDFGAKVGENFDCF